MSIRHYQGFDGLRAFSVLGVMIYHLGWPGFGYGWAGVPFFFVLSGFLITGILLDNKGDEPGHFFTAFYARRTLRIFPLYFVFLVTVALWCAVLGVKTTGWWYFILYVQNYYLGARNFQLVAGMDLGHTWSLAVEEQFYLLWPLVVYCVPVRFLKVVITVLVVICVTSRYWIAHNTDFVAFAPLTSNLDTLSLGAFLAILVRESPKSFKRWAWAFLILGVASLVWIITRPGESLNASNSRFMFGQALLFGGILGIVTVYRLPLLEWKPLAYIGRISYGLYIWHALGFNIVSVAIYHGWMRDYGEPAMGILRLTLTFAVSIASFHVLELPILGIKDRITYGRRAKSVAQVAA